MTSQITYITTDGSVTVPDDSKEQLHLYHNAIKQRLDNDVELRGLTGRGNGIKKVVVSAELSDSVKSDIENYLKTGIEIVPDK